MAASAEDFFYEHAGYSYPSGATKREKERARREAARELAKAEEYAEDAGWVVEWSHDEFPDTSWMDEEQMAAYESGRMEILDAVLKDEDGNVLASLGGNAVMAHRTSGRDHRRVVEAELAAEALAEKGRRPVRPNPERADTVVYLTVGAHDVMVVVAGQDSRLLQSVEADVKWAAVERAGASVEDEPPPHVELPYDDWYYMGFTAHDEPDRIPHLIEAMVHEAKSWRGHGVHVQVTQGAQRPNASQAEKVMRAAENNRYAAAGAFHTAAGIVYSYDLPIAKFDYPPSVLDKKHSPSVTTSKHIGFVMRAWPNARIVPSVRS